MTSPTPTGNNPQHEQSTAPQNAPHHRTTRVGTIVWGVALLAVAAVLMAVAAGATIDIELAVIIGLAIAGVALVIGSLVTAARRSRRRAGPGA